MPIKTRVFLWGGYGTGNLGDDILVKSMMSMLLDDYNEGDIAIRNRSSSEYISSWYPRVKTVRDTKVVDTEKLVFGGGTQIFSFPSRYKGLLKYASQLKSYLKSKYIWNIDNNRYRNVRFKSAYSFSVGVGPFYGNTSVEQYALKWININDVFFARDMDSYLFSKQCDTEAYIYPDIAYYKDLWVEGQHLKKNKNEFEKNVSFVLRDWKRGNVKDRYFKYVIQGAQHLENKGYNVTFFIFSSEDVRVINELKQRELQYKVWNPSDNKVVSYVNTLQERSDVIISSRAHGIVLGYILGIPTIGIMVDKKVKLIRYLSTIGYEWNNPFRREIIVKMLEHIKYNYEQIVETIKNEYEVREELSRTGCNKFRSVLLHESVCESGV